MNDSSGRTSSLAITEKRPHRPGSGCVGIFFHLFDWNRKFAKKKLFSKKLLPPAHAKQASKKFGGDEKQPKLLLIADENSGGFPNVKKNGILVNREQNHGVKAPGLVARLMGLEYMLAVQQDNLKKSSSSEIGIDRSDGFVGDNHGFCREVQNLDKEPTNNELRPQKLQKSGPFERLPVSRFGAEALQFKNVLSRSRKHHPKFSSPVKSPRSLSSRNASQLIGAATKILEPETMTAQGSNYYTSEAKLSKGNSSCKNCGNLLDVVDARPKLKEHESVFGSSVLNNVSSSSQGSERSQQCKLQKDSPLSIYLEHKSQRQKTASVVRDMVSPRSKFRNLQRNRVALAANAINETKDFISLNLSLSGRTQIRSRLPTKVGSVKFDTESKFGNRQDDSLSPVRKRRLMDVDGQGEGSSFVCCTSEKQKSTSYNAITGKEIRHKLAHFRESNTTGDSESGGVSFTFSSPMKHKNGVYAEMEKSRDQVYSTYNNTHQKNSSFDGIEKQFPLKEDTLAVVLAQKLKELTSQEEDELAYECITPKKTSAMILQELISALNAERPYPQDDMAVRSMEIDSYLRGHTSTTNRNTTFKAKANIGGGSIKYSPGIDNLSPGSILEASFSIDSSFSNNLDDDSRHKPHSDSRDCSYHTLQPIEHNTYMTSKEFVTDLHNHISEELCSINLAGSPLKGIKLFYAKEAIMNAELLIRNAVLHNLDGTLDFSITCFLVNELEALANVTRAEFSCFLGFGDAIDGDKLMAFLFDSVVEYLESRYGRYSESGFKAWTRMMPVCMDGEIMIREVVDEIRRWISYQGLIIDEVIEREMSYGPGKWSDFEIEAFEGGAEIDGEIIHILVDEVVMDLLSCSAKF